MDGELSEKRKQMQGIIKNIENNLDIAIEQFGKTGDAGYEFQIKHYSSQLKQLRDEVWDHERMLQGETIRKNLKLLVVGHGFVGKAVADHIEPHVKQVVRIDPAFFTDSIADHPDADAAIIAVPTPQGADGECDDSIVRSVIDQLNNATDGKIKILLKSTVSPERISHYPDNVTYNPEFLRAKTAAEDFANQKFMVLGGLDRAYWHRVFLYIPGIEVLRTDRITSSMVKYMHNTWLAMKVAYFHEIYNRVGQYYNHADMIEILSRFENVGPSHMQAPNDEGQLGYSGYCFPKDTAAFHKFTGSEILERVIAVNNDLNKKTS